MRNHARIACVIVIAAVATYGCGLTAKRRGGGTNLDALGSGYQLPPPGQPALHDDEPR